MTTPDGIITATSVEVRGSIAILHIYYKPKMDQPEECVSFWVDGVSLFDLKERANNGLSGVRACKEFKGPSISEQYDMGILTIPTSP